MKRLPARALQWQAGDVVALKAKCLPALVWRANIPIHAAPASGIYASVRQAVGNSNIKYFYEKIWVRKARSFSESEEQDLDYYFAMSPHERVEIVQFLREQYPKFGKVNVSEGGKRLRRFVRIVKQA